MCYGSSSMCCQASIEILCTRDRGMWQAEAVAMEAMTRDIQIVEGCTAEGQVAGSFFGSFIITHSQHPSHKIRITLHLLDIGRRRFQVLDTASSAFSTQ